MPTRVIWVTNQSIYLFKTSLEALTKIVNQNNHPKLSAETSVENKTNMTETKYYPKEWPRTLTPKLINISATNLNPTLMTCVTAKITAPQQNQLNKSRGSMPRTEHNLPPKTERSPNSRNNISLTDVAYSQNTKTSIRMTSTLNINLFDWINT